MHPKLKESFENGEEIQEMVSRSSRLSGNLSVSKLEDGSIVTRQAPT